jgi:hypothetical protein
MRVNFFIPRSALPGPLRLGKMAWPKWKPVKQHRVAHGQLNSVGYERSNRKAASPVGTGDRRGSRLGRRMLELSARLQLLGQLHPPSLCERLFVAPGRAPLTRCLGAGWRGRAMPCRRGCRARDVSRRLQHVVDRRDSDLELFMRRFLFSRKPTASKLTNGLMSRLPPQS